MPNRGPLTPNLSSSSRDSSPAEAASSSSSSSASASASISASASTSQEGLSSAVTVSPNRPRKRPGQTKSRTGCYACKRRKVKCNEHWPECDNCKRLKLDCVYPWGKRMAGREQPSTPLRTTPMALTLEDLRFYHFFMTICYPRWPSDLIAQRTWGQAAAMSGNVGSLLMAN